MTVEMKLAVPAIVFEWEHAIPFMAWTIFPYWSINAFYGASLFVCRTQDELDRLLRPSSRTGDPMAAAPDGAGLGLVIAKTATIVPQQSAFVVERLGRYAGTLDAGFHILVPFVDVIRYGFLLWAPSYLFEVKAPNESRGTWDYLKVVATTPAEEAFRPVAEGGCPLVRS